MQRDHDRRTRAQPGRAVDVHLQPAGVGAEPGHPDRGVRRGSRAGSAGEQAGGHEGGHEQESQQGTAPHGASSGSGSNTTEGMAPVTVRQ